NEIDAVFRHSQSLSNHQSRGFEKARADFRGELFSGGETNANRPQKTPCFGLRFAIFRQAAVKTRNAHENRHLMTIDDLQQTLRFRFSSKDHRRRALSKRIRKPAGESVTPIEGARVENDVVRLQIHPYAAAGVMGGNAAMSMNHGLRFSLRAARVEPIG